MIEGPHLLQLTHEGELPFMLRTCFDVGHPAILPMLWPFTTVVTDITKHANMRTISNRDTMCVNTIKQGHARLTASVRSPFI